MLPHPADIFTEPGGLSPDGPANLGPLRQQARVRQADKGIDIDPSAEGPERRVFARQDQAATTRGDAAIFSGWQALLSIVTSEKPAAFSSAHICLNSRP